MTRLYDFSKFREERDPLTTTRADRERLLRDAEIMLKEALAEGDPEDIKEARQWVAECKARLGR